MTSTADVRKLFLDFFKVNGHEIVPSSPLVPQNDPTLMFTNAGMVQFKNYFTGVETPSYTRAASSQKCVRAGGKHNDLENVGYTARHHTFFEMLGNFSFGDYFKELAIELAWNLVTKELRLPKDKLLVTVYHTDDEAAALWKKIAGLKDEKIIRIPTNDNFWAMGDTGPCGPCSEIFYDHGDKIPGGPPGSADADGDRFIEIWNLVFMQYEQQGPDKRINLPKPSIDTGMGLERTAAILQGQHDNYDIDIFRTLIAASADMTGVKAEGEARASHRVIADHLRSTSFLIAEGVLPSNEGRGYVLRRIMRRAMRHAHMLGAKDPLMYRLVPTLVAQMGEAYPELKRGQSLITETLKLEESRFKDTLERGLKLLEQESKSLKSGGKLAGDIAFKLYDTYGFPLDLTQDILKSRQVEVDQAGFDAAMAEQKARARAAWAGSGEKAEDSLWYEIEEEAGATDFLGYAQLEAQAQVRALVKDAKPVKSAGKGDEIWVVANQTPFYGESGGQIGDTGVLSAGGSSHAVLDTQKFAGGKLFAHKVKLSGPLKTGDDIVLRVEGQRRQALKAHHSATHLLHAALREILGDHVTQKGSLVAPDRLRFDISHPKAIDKADLARIEARVNEEIRLNTEIATQIMTPDEAIQMGAMALFGEKYGDEVRVVKMGGNGWSLELCGGTHVERTGDIGYFKLIGEAAISSGVRRIEAVCAAAAESFIREEEAVLQQVADLLSVGPSEITSRLSALVEERKKLEQDVSALRKKLALSGGGGSASQTDEVNGIQFTSLKVQDVPAKELRPMVDELRQKLKSGVVGVIAENEGKVSIVVGVTADLVKRISAVDLVKLGSEKLGGSGGGGKPDIAQAGGADATRSDEAFAAIRQQLAQL